MYGRHQAWRGWDLRVDGVAFVQLLSEPRDRHRTGGASRHQVDSVNWGMAMARRTLHGGRLGIRTMLSAEPWTVGDCGSISFLATGEVCEGDSVHDRQQPHDLVMELAADYEHRVTGEWRWQVYGGLAGEPALGPPGYPHRVSAIANPTGPITHHWLDSTHVTYGLVTLGVHNLRWKAEASVFNGREPDDSRADLDLGAFDSVAARLSFLPSERLALQVSVGRLREAITDFPTRSPAPTTRVTASAMYQVPMAGADIWATTVALGVNHAREFAAGGLWETTTAGALLETSVTLSGRHIWFGRGEIGGVPAHHLHAHEFSGSVFTVGKLQLGYLRQFGGRKGMVPGIGGSAALSVLAPLLASRYSSRTAPSFVVFLRLGAARHQM